MSIKDQYAFRTGDHVLLGGITALCGRTGIVRGCRTAATRGHDYFVYFDEPIWPLIPENGIWAHESYLSLKDDESDAVREASRHLRAIRKVAYPSSARRSASAR